jgi:hypothetical protein
MNPAEGAASDPVEDFRAWLRQLPQGELDAWTADAPGFDLPEDALDVAGIRELSVRGAGDPVGPVLTAYLIALERKRRKDLKLSKHAAYRIALEDEVQRRRAARQAAAPPANTPAAEAPPPAETAGGEGRPAGAVMSRQEAAERLERLRARGEAWPGCRKMAERLGCSKTTVSKAIHSTRELAAWAKRQAAPRAEQSLDDEKAGAKEDIPQRREPDPAEDAAVAELRARLEASPDERAFLHEIGGASREFLLWYVQESDPRRKACRQKWAADSRRDPKWKAWFLGLPAKEQPAYFDDPGGCPGAFPRP